MSPERKAFYYTISSGCFAMVFMLAVASVAYASREAMVLVDRLNLRARPDLQSRAIAVLPKNTRVAVVKSRDKWLKVRYKKKIGYLRNSRRYVKFLSAQTLPSKAERKIKKVREKARNLKQKIKSSEAAVVSYTKQETEVVRSLDQIERSLDRARKRVAAARAELSGMDRELAKNQRILDKLESRIAVAEAYAADRLVALYKLNWLGRFNILASADSMGAMLQRERALSRILEQDEQHLEVLERNYERLEALQAKQRKRKADKEVLENEYRLRAREMATEKSRRSKVLTDIRSKKSLELAAIEVFREDARNLDRIIRQLGQAVAQEPVRPVETQETPSSAQPGSFTARKGLLKLPVEGKIKNSFGTYRNEKFKTKNFRSGIDISADRGEPVHSVFPGRVLYSSWFKGYGNMLILDHGGHYYTVYAHVEELFKKKGEVVEENEVIATVGDTGSLEGPGLYFEVRYHGKPLDPAKWIKKG